MLAKVISGATQGLESIPITVEVDINNKSLPSFTIVGLPSKSVEESKERVRAAIKNSGADFPPHRITVNLAPADIPKEGPAYDLPIALGILIASGQLTVEIKKHLFFGELSLDGTLRHTHGILPIALLTKERKYKGLFIPEINAKEAAIVDGVKIFPVTSLISLFHHFNGTQIIKNHPHISFSRLQEEVIVDFDLSDIKGQEQAKRALEISAAGGHNLHLKGVPGAGKTMLARALPGILPDLTETEALEVTKIYSITGNIPEGASIIKVRPFRAPHHTTSRIGLIGGSSHRTPGEISLAHRGVLFLDEFPEFPRHVLEALRQPIEDGIVTISRAAGTVTYPAKFVLVAASNPCPCGFWGDPVKRCRCMPGQIAQYKKRISGPIIDRIDLHIDLPPVKVDRLTSDLKCETSQRVKKRVQKARNMQTLRYKKIKLVCNSDLNSKNVKELIPLSSDSTKLLRQAVSTMHLSARTYYRSIKVARTIADLEGEENISLSNVAEALQYRPKEEL
ncbi:magnesium chelatase [Candidatus Gottesmanbacteria bacterium RIFCSPLOWO2_01_FULL_39_12b]|uniref:Magnesium chelatase n=1 Tax=Candidatus Gottesmanbacteria bacterium RIFCSPLOWO2_01_FULL_39_12b TaxID=1798388 RepID=A0A1F6ANV0_9BACT|nr:MAG: magnesium chelatase [Candidatus Gottesmanbacteria bacterium RIFCSPLOWO2_01_FULL_39_12b]